MRVATMFLTLTIFFTMPSMAGGSDGMIRKASPHGVGETLDRLEDLLERKGITVALRWRHGARAGEADIALRETEVMIFGNPAIGSHLMTSRQTAGIDLPMKALAWRDENRQVWLAFNDPEYIAARHGIDDRDDVLEKMANALDKLTSAAVATE